MEEQEVRGASVPDPALMNSEPAALRPSGFDPSRGDVDEPLTIAMMNEAFDELHACCIRRSGAICEVRKEFLRIALEVLGERVRASSEAPEVALYRIEKDVPIPARGYGRRGGTIPRYPWNDMEIGDSFFIPNPITQDYISGARHYAQRGLKRKFITRIVEGGIRVWRINCDSDASLAEDPQGLSGEAAAARAGGIAQPPSPEPLP